MMRTHSRQGSRPSRRDALAACLRQVARHVGESRPQQRRDRRVGLGERIVGTIRRSIGAATRARSSSTCADAPEHARPARQPADDVERRRHVHHAGRIDAAVRGADAVEPAERGRHAHRAAGVAAQREIAGAGRGRRRRSARRAARDAARRARIERRAVMRVDAGDAVEELVADGLADDGGAGVEQLRTAAAWARAGACAASQSGLPPPVRSPAMSYMSLTAALRPASGPSAAPSSGAFRSCGTKTERARAFDIRASEFLWLRVPRYQSRILLAVPGDDAGLRQNLLEGALDVPDAVRHAGQIGMQAIDMILARSANSSYRQSK